MNKVRWMRTRRRRKHAEPGGMTRTEGGYASNMATKTRHELDAADRNAMSDSTYAFPRVR